MGDFFYFIYDLTRHEIHNGFIEAMSYEASERTYIGAKYLVFVSSRSVKTRELSFAQFVYFLRKVWFFSFFE